MDEDYIESQLRIDRRRVNGPVIRETQFRVLGFGLKHQWFCAWLSHKQPIDLIDVPYFGLWVRLNKEDDKELQTKFKVTKIRDSFKPYLRITDRK
jgi:hypothetical protein